MGGDTVLQAQLPIQLITFKRLEDNKPSQQSEFQYLRLWQVGHSQFLTFFCNITSKKYREFKGGWSGSRILFPIANIVQWNIFALLSLNQRQW